MKLNSLEKYSQILLSQVKKTIVAVELLDINERPINRIEGDIISGSISIDGDSTIRRTASLVFMTTDKNYKILETSNLLAINKKIKIFIGVQDLTDQSMKEPYWFKLGVYVMSKCTSSASIQGQQINITAQDKMCLHNGDIAGKLEYTTRLDSEVITPDYYQNIVNIQNSYKKIEDEPNNKNIYADEILSYLNLVYPYVEGDNSILETEVIGLISKIQILKTIDVSNEENFEKQLQQISEAISRLNSDCKNKKLTIMEIIKYAAISLAGELPGKVIINDVPEKIKTPIYINEDENIIGYKMIKYIYPEELTLNTGDVVTTIYEKCKEALGGNYEYFYDVDGNFIFQEIKNYINNNIPEIEDLVSSNYKYSFSKTPIQFDFSKYNIVTNYTSTPNWNNIKNDYYVWGKNEDALIGYHLVIDDKPTIPDYVKDYTNTKDNIMDWREYIIHNHDIGEDNIFVGKCYEKDLSLMEKNKNNSTCCVIKNDNLPHYMIYQNNNWEELDLQNVKKSVIVPNYYNELSSIWKNDRYEANYEKKIKKEYNFNFDIIEGDKELSKFSIATIGRRKEPLEDENIKQLYPTIVQEILVYYDEDDLNYSTDPDNAIKIEEIEDFKKYPAAGNIYKDAFSTIKKQLYSHTIYNEQIQIEFSPVYDLDVNRRCYAYFKKTNTNGFFMIKKINFNLEASGTMTASLIKTEQAEYNNKIKDGILTENSLVLFTENSNYLMIE